MGECERVHFQIVASVGPLLTMAREYALLIGGKWVESDRKWHGDLALAGKALSMPVARLMRVRRDDTPAIGAGDRRCILYTSQVRSTHRTVQVQRADDASPHNSDSSSVCFAQLRPVVDERDASAAAASHGLWTALSCAIDGSSTAAEVQVTAYDGDEGGKVSNSQRVCSCACGQVAAVELQFFDRTEPPRAVANGLKRVVVKVIHVCVVLY